MKLYKGDRVRVIADPYSGMGVAQVGDEAVVTKVPSGGQSRLVSLRFANGTRVKCWMVHLPNGGQPTLERF